MFEKTKSKYKKLFYKKRVDHPKDQPDPRSLKLVLRPQRTMARVRRSTTLRGTNGPGPTGHGKRASAVRKRSSNYTEEFDGTALPVFINQSSSLSASEAGLNI